MRRIVFPCIVLLSVIVLHSCNPKGELQDEDINNKLDTASITHTKQVLKANEDIMLWANLFSGIESNNPEAAKIQATKAWQDHKDRLNKEWQNLDENILQKMRKWTLQEGISKPEDTLTLFYPFSGPDFLFANTLFPYSKKIIMVGLEPEGKLSDILAMSQAQLDLYLDKIRKSLYIPNRIGFFRTLSMENDLTDQTLNGTVHIISLYMVKTGHQIAAIEYIYVDSFGKEVVFNDERPAKNGTAKGLRIKYFNENDTDYRTLYYFPFDLSDKNMIKYPDFMFFIENQGTKLALAKSASYLMHSDSFSAIRRMFLSQSKKILQDDTGAKYIDIVNEGFYTAIYGEYSKTIAMFNFRYQPEYKEAFQQRTAKDIDFKIGYNTKHGESSFIFASRDSIYDTGASDSVKVVIDTIH